MLEGTALCFMEPAWPSLVAAAAAGTCGEVGGELGDLLSDALGLADRFSGCAPSLPCKNQNSTVSPAVTTVGIWRREEEGGGRPHISPDRDHVLLKTEAHAQQTVGRQGDWVHATARLQTARNNQRTAQNADIHMQNNCPEPAKPLLKQSCTSTCTRHMTMQYIGTRGHFKQQPNT